MMIRALLILVTLLLAAQALAHHEQCWVFLAETPKQLVTLHGRILDQLALEPEYKSSLKAMLESGNPFKIPSTGTTVNLKLTQALKIIEENAQKFGQEAAIKAELMDAVQSRLEEIEGVRKTLSETRKQAAKVGAKITKFKKDGEFITTLDMSQDGSVAYITSTDPTKKAIEFKYVLDVVSLKDGARVGGFNFEFENNLLTTLINTKTKIMFFLAEMQKDRMIGVIDLASGNRLWMKPLNWIKIEGEGKIAKQSGGETDYQSSFLKRLKYKPISITFPHTKVAAVSDEGQLVFRGTERYLTVEPKKLSDETPRLSAYDSQIQIFSQNNGELRGTIALPHEHLVEIVPLSDPNKVIVISRLQPNNRPDVRTLRIFDISEMNKDGFAKIVAEYDDKSELYPLSTSTNSPDGTFATYDKPAKLMRIVNPVTGFKTSIPTSFDVDVFALSKDGTRLAFGSRDHESGIVVDVATGKETGFFKTHKTLWNLSFSADGKSLYSAGTNEFSTFEIVTDRERPDTG